MVFSLTQDIHIKLSLPGIVVSSSCLLFRFQLTPHWLCTLMLRIQVGYLLTPFLIVLITSLIYHIA